MLASGMNWNVSESVGKALAVERSKPMLVSLKEVNGSAFN